MGHPISVDMMPAFPGIHFIHQNHHIIMKHSLLLLLCSVSFFTTVFSQDTSVLKRQAYKLVLQVDKETVYEENLAESRYVHPDNTVQLYPGEKIFIEIEEEKGVIKKVTAVKENLKPNKTVTLDFRQAQENGVHQSIMLSVKNPFEKKLVYEATIYLIKPKKWVSTDVYPVEPGLVGIELWPDLISSIGIGKWKFEE